MTPRITKQPKIFIKTESDQNPVVDVSSRLKFDQDDLLLVSIIVKTIIGFNNY